MADKFLNTTGLSYLWEKIATLLYGKQDKINNPDGNSILIDDGTGQAVDSHVSINTIATFDDITRLSVQVANKMNLISNSTEKILVSNTNGQAVESSLSISDVATQSDLSGKQDVLTAGTGIDISNNTISNVFQNLASPNLNDITYNFQGYVQTPTNQPTGYASGSLIVVCRADNLSGVQMFIPYNTNKLFQRIFYTSSGNLVWGTWEELTDKVSKTGDTMTGALTINNNQQLKMNTDADFSTTPSSNYYSSGIRFFDSNKAQYGVAQVCNLTNGNKGFTVGGRRIVSGTTYDNYLRLMINASGNMIVQVPDTAKSAWLSAIGAQATLVSGTNIRTINNTSVLGSGNLTLVSGVKGNAESSYRSGNVNLTPANIGAAPLYDGQINYPIGNGTNYVAIRRGGSTSSSSAYVGFFTYKNSDDSYINRLETLVNSNGTRNFAVLSDLTYNSGDTFTVPGNYQIFACYIYAPTDYNNVRFFIPTDKPITASTVTCGKLTMTLQTAKNAQGAFLINNINVKATSGYKITCTARGSGIYVDLKCPTTISLTNRDTGTVILGSSTFTFS